MQAAGVLLRQAAAIPSVLGRISIKEEIVSLCLSESNPSLHTLSKERFTLRSVLARSGASASISSQSIPASKKMEDDLSVSVRRTLFKKLDSLQPKRGDGAAGPRGTKVTVVGVGNVGMACAQTILTEGLVSEMALVDVDANKVRGELLDLQHAAAFLPRVKLTADTDYAVSAGSDVVVVTAGARQREGESRLSLVGRNVAIFKGVIPQLVKHSPDAILLIVANPVDILTWVAWKISGLPEGRVIGSGTNLDSSRLKNEIANALDMNAQNVHAHVIGEHGDSSVPLWSSVSVGGIPLMRFLEDKEIPLTKETCDRLHKKVVESAYEVIKLKGYTSWAIGYSTASLVRSLLTNQRRIHPVSVLATGFHGIEEEVFLSLPAILGDNGVASIANSMLNNEEREKLCASAKTLAEVQNQLGL